MSSELARTDKTISDGALASQENDGVETSPFDDGDRQYQGFSFNIPEGVEHLRIVGMPQGFVAGDTEATVMHFGPAYARNFIGNVPPARARKPSEVTLPTWHPWNFVMVFVERSRWVGEISLADLKLHPGGAQIEISGDFATYFPRYAIEFF